MIRSAVRRTITLAAAGLLAACSAGEPEEGDAGPVTGLDGPDRTLAWSPQEVYAVGGFNAPEWAEFGSIDGVDFDSEGNLFLLDGQTQTITQISPTGEFVRTISGPGEGPGELASPMSLFVSPQDELVLPDFGHQGFVKFANDGTWIDNVTIDLANEGLTNELHFLPDGSAIGTASFRISMGPGSGSSDSEEEEPEGRPLHRYSMESGVEGDDFFYAWEPPPPPDGGETELAGGSSSGGNVMLRMSRLRAFSPQLHAATLPSGRVAVVDSTTWRIRMIDPATGQVVGEHTRPIPPTPVDDRIRDLEREVRMAQTEESGGGVRVFGGGGGMSFDQEQVRNMMRERIENMVFYDEIPAIEELAADREGRLWVQRSSGVPGEEGGTDVLTEDGEYLGTLPADGLRIPDAFGPNGLIAVIETDEFDVATVRVLRVPTS